MFTSKLFKTIYAFCVFFFLTSFILQSREINSIILHCTATRATRRITAKEIRRYHVDILGWKDIGYHYVILTDGTVETGRDLSAAGAHCKGHNANSIGIVYVGGIDSRDKPADTRTDSQKASMDSLICVLQRIYPNASVYGHRDFANKACPCFEAGKEYR